MSSHLSREADRLKNDEIFNKALADIRSDALNALAAADADDKTTILRMQQRVAVIDEIRTTLDRYILQGSEDLADGNSSYA